MSNPFQPEMVKLQVPEGMGSSVSVAGFLLPVDADGCVEVPKQHADELRAHGLTDPGAKKPVKK